MIDELIKVVKDERKHEIEEAKEKTSVKVLEIVGGTVTLNFEKHLYFESGDIIGYESAEGKDVLGSIVNVDYDTNMLTVSLYSQPKFEEGETINIFESETLIGYELEIKFLGRIKREDISRQERSMTDYFFKPLKFEKINRKERLYDKEGMAGFTLDDSQIEVIESILSLDNGEIILVIGPPGTGKTQVIAKAAYELSKRGEKVLICSHTNRAVDNVMENLPLEKTLRVGRPEKVHPKIRKYMLSSKARTEIGSRLEEIEEEISAGRIGHEELNKLLAERSLMIKETNERLVNESPLIGSTLIKSQLYPLEYVKFDTVFIDECSQASIPLSLLGMLKGKKCILVGDHKQLLPIFKSINEEALQEKYSAFNHLLKKHPERSIWLKYHYRSNAEIIGFSQQRFYENKIKPAERCYDLKLGINGWQSLDRGKILDPNKPVVFVHVEGEETYDGISKYNDKEAEVCSEIVKNILGCGTQPDEIGIITPYRMQRAIVREKVGKEIEVNTVDAFQGRQKDVIIYSIASTKSKFASNPNRINVAFTRPIYKLIVVGNAIYARGEIEKFMEYALDRNGVYSWENKKWFGDEIKSLNEVKRYIISQTMSGEYSDDKIYVSELGFCIRKAWFKRKMPKEIDFNTALKMLIGSLFHEIIEKNYNETEKSAVATIHVDGKKVEIRGRIDAVVGNGIIDFKSKDGRGLSRIKENGPSRYDEKQIKFYARAGGYKKALLQYYQIDPKISIDDMTNPKEFISRLKEKISRAIREPITFEVDVENADVTKEYEKLATVLYKSLIKNEPPAFEPKKWMCTNCEYRHICKAR